ncbi:MAG: DNA polymerase III subunit delta' [Desulfovibrionaceae bacterium]|nr:DNA polymerase III subunit delta' [Desulfovibrionaceae bacterium]
MEPLFDEIGGPSFASLKQRLSLLGENPPQVLLLDGGSEAQRLAAARWWACRCICPSATVGTGPCLVCDTCRQVAEQEHLDVPAFDGRISNKQDEEDPGPVRALNMDNVRVLKGLLKDPPHGSAVRVVLLMGLERTRSNAANALLKVLEEPSKHNLFVLLAAQREQLLPTLVSRSHCLVLPWPDPEFERSDQIYRDLARDLEEFFSTGRMLFARTALKSFDAAQAGLALDIVQKSVLRCLTGRAGGGVDRFVMLLDPVALTNVSRWIGEARAKIQEQVSGPRVIETFMTRLFLLIQRARG